jgi:hypothetical protein
MGGRFCDWGWRGREVCAGAGEVRRGGGASERKGSYTEGTEFSQSLRRDGRGELRNDASFPMSN